MEKLWYVKKELPTDTRKRSLTSQSCDQDFFLSKAKIVGKTNLSTEESR